jgi:hypothetical protein
MVFAVASTALGPWLRGLHGLCRNEKDRSFVTLQKTLHERNSALLSIRGCQM